MKLFCQAKNLQKTGSKIKCNRTYNLLPLKSRKFIMSSMNPALYSAYINLSHEFRFESMDVEVD